MENSNGYALWQKLLDTASIAVFGVFIMLLLWSAVESYAGAAATVESVGLRITVLALLAWLGFREQEAQPTADAEPRISAPATEPVTRGPAAAPAAAPSRDAIGSAAQAARGETVKSPEPTTAR